MVAHAVASSRLSPACSSCTSTKSTAAVNYGGRSPHVDDDPGSFKNKRDRGRFRNRSERQSRTKGDG
jgi:hypothetical protein